MIGQKTSHNKNTVPQYNCGPLQGPQCVISKDRIICDLLNYPSNVTEP